MYRFRSIRTHQLADYSDSLLADEFDGPGKCIITGDPVDRRVTIAKAY